VVDVGDDGDVADGLCGSGAAHFGCTSCSLFWLCILGWARRVVLRMKMRVTFSLAQWEIYLA
jgi:hypothetical protein